MTVGLVVLEFRTQRRRRSKARLVNSVVFVLALSSSMGLKVIPLLSKNAGKTNDGGRVKKLHTQAGPAGHHIFCRVTFLAFYFAIRSNDMMLRGRCQCSTRIRVYIITSFIPFLAVLYARLFLSSLKSCYTSPMGEGFRQCKTKHRVPTATPCNLV